MPLPSSVSTGVVTGSFVYGDGTPVVGTVTFTPTWPLLLVPADDVAVIPGPITATLDGTGAFSVALIATDDPDINPRGWTYWVSVDYGSGAKKLPPFAISVPSGSVQNLADITPVPAADGTYYLVGPKGDTGAAGSGSTIVVARNTDNLAVGDRVQESITTGASNVGVGYWVQRLMTTGSFNMAMGWKAQELMINGLSNIGIGRSTQASSQDGTQNVAIGRAAQFAMTSASNNVSIGHFASYAPKNDSSKANVLANRTTHIGAFSGAASATQADDSVAVGYYAAAEINATAVGSGATAAHDGSVALGKDSTTTATGQVMVGPRDVELTDSTKGIVLKSPNGTRYRVTVSNAGALVVTAA